MTTSQTLASSEETQAELEQHWTRLAAAFPRGTVGADPQHWATVHRTLAKLDERPPATHTRIQCDGFYSAIGGLNLSPRTQSVEHMLFLIVRAEKQVQNTVTDESRTAYWQARLARLADLRAFFEAI